MYPSHNGILDIHKLSGQDILCLNLTFPLRSESLPFKSVAYRRGPEIAKSY
jgi:hypothetical protein